MPEPGPGEAVVRVQWLSIDPTIRTWMDDAPGYLPPIEIDAVVRSGGIGEVVASNNDDYPVGATVFGMLGWQDHAVIGGPGRPRRSCPTGVEPTAALSVFGTTGMTAYFGLLDIGEPKPGATVVVSGAAGATGSVVGQIAKIKGAGNVVGIAGSDEKCAWLVDELGLRRRRSTTRPSTSPSASASCAPTASTSTSTTSAARSSTPASASSP